MCVQQIIKLMKTPMQVVKVYYHSNISVVSSVTTRTRGAHLPHVLLTTFQKTWQFAHVYLFGMGVTKFHLFTNRNFVTLVRDISEKHKMQETELL